MSDAPTTTTNRSLSEPILAFMVVFVIGLLVIPLPPFILDLFLVLSIGLSLVVLLVAVQAETPLSFSAFPSMLLLLTLLRLSLNVSSTRLILGRGEAGAVIQSFGNFVIGGNYAVGVVLFLILVAINFTVITKGAGRVAEVAARFTLDAMPGRQMSIDGDLNAGLIDDKEAKRRREEISQQADFYGAMDGAAKFVRGDAVAGLIITAVNILGGLFIGTVQLGMPVGQALADYTLLTVGDGLVSQIPALVSSTAAGIMVTRSTDGGPMGESLMRQIGDHPQALAVAGMVLMGLGMVPGMPTLPFVALGGGVGLLWRASKKRIDAAVVQRIPEEDEELPDQARDPLHELLHIDPVELEVGYGLIPMIDEKAGGTLLERIATLRRQAAQELGFLIPSVRIRDDVALPANDYVIRVRGTEVSRWELMPTRLLALETSPGSDPIDGIPTREPSFGMAAHWIAPREREDAEYKGYVVVEAPTVLATHLMETLRGNAADLLGRQDVQEMVTALKDTYPALIEGIVPDKIPLGTLHRVLQRLVKERVPIRDLVTILETLADLAETTTNVEVLTEKVRSALGSTIAEQYTNESGAIRGITIGAELEGALLHLFNPRQTGASTALLDPDSLTGLLNGLGTILRDFRGSAERPPLIAPPGLRAGIRRLIEPVLPDIPVLSLSELPPQIAIDSLATWEVADVA